jgi:uncharacterized protein
MSVDPELPADAQGPVTTAVTRRVKPGHEAAYEAFLAGISGAARAFPGYLGVEVFRPTPGATGDYRTVYCFDSPAHLHAWLDSAEHAAWLARAEPHVAGPMRTQVLVGPESWFTLPGQPGAPPPPLYRMALVTWATIFPLITLVVVATAGPAGDLEDLGGVWEPEVVDRDRLEGAQLDAAVAAVAGAIRSGCLRRGGTRRRIAPRSQCPRSPG